MARTVAGIVTRTVAGVVADIEIRYPAQIIQTHALLERFGHGLRINKRILRFRL